MPDVPNVSLYGVHGSTCSDRVSFTAYELGIPLDYHFINVKEGIHKQPEHLARQPFGKIPAAEIDGISVYESRAICRALARSVPAGEKLFPSSDLRQVAQFEQWASLEQGTITATLEKIVTERVFKALFRKIPADEQVVKDALEEGQTGFAVLDKQLATTGQYVLGDFSLIDVFLSTYFSRFAGTPEGKDTLAKYSNIGAWWERVSARPAWQKVMAERII